MVQRRFHIFEDIPASEVAAILEGVPTRSYAKGDVLLREGEANDRIFLLDSGALEVWKGPLGTPQGVRVATLNAGECFGEMSAINASPSSATIVAASDARVFLIQLPDLPERGGVRQTVTRNLARTLVDRLSRANESIHEKHERELAAMRKVASASAFLTRILIALSFYMFSMPAIVIITPLLPSNSLISFFFIAAFGWLVYDFIRDRREVLTEYFFMTFEHWPRQCWRGLLWALPLMTIPVAIKLSAMHAHPGKFAFFEPMRAIGRLDEPNYPLWAAFAVTYSVLTFVQEYIRCAVQGTLEMINVRATTGGHWKAIIVSDLVFSLLHMHLGGWFAVQAFIAGFYFGYVFWRERSYLTVAVAHSVVGVWAVFIVGILT